MRYIMYTTNPLGEHETWHRTSTDPARTQPRIRTETTWTPSCRTTGRHMNLVTAVVFVNAYIKTKFSSFHFLWCVLFRFVPDREFSGTDHGPRRDGPVQFEEDPFGLDKFLEEAKQHGGSKRPSTAGRSKDYDHDKKRRKE